MAEAEALILLNRELSQQQACIARASCILGCLQDHLFDKMAGTVVQVAPLEAVVDTYMSRFQDQLVLPAAGKLTKCKKPQDKVIAVAKFLRTKLAKAPAHKQPLHTQYLPSALRDSGKRQLDCLGIATAVLSLCQAIAARDPATHSDLAAAGMVVSDDHCWLQLPAPEGGSNGQVHVEVTDPRLLEPAHMANWLYAGCHGIPCSSQQVLMMLVAGLMPEELKDDQAAGQLRSVQMFLLQQLSQQHPEALLYSNFFRWGMLYEELELDKLVEAAELGNMAQLQQLALQGPEELTSQQYYTRSLALSNGWQWHPSSCAAFGWLNRMQAALCGDTDNLLLLSKRTCSGEQQQPQPVAPWLGLATFLLQQALAAVSSCTQVLRQYSGCASKPDKAADKQLLDAITDLWANLADACKAVACLQRLQEQQQQQQQEQQQQEQQQQQQQQEQQQQQQQQQEQQQQEQQEGQQQQEQQQQQQEQQEGQQQEQQEQQQQEQQEQQQEQQQQWQVPLLPAIAAGAPATVASAASAEKAHQTLPQDKGGHVAHGMPAAAAVTGSTVHLAAAVAHAAGHEQASASAQALTTTSVINVINDRQLVVPLLLFMDALCAYFGDESADTPAQVAQHFVAAAACFTAAARDAAAVQAASNKQQLLSARMQALVDASSEAWLSWRELRPDLQQLVQMPSSRKRKFRE